MNPSGVELLRSLGSGVLPPGVDGVARRGSVETMGFSDLLSKARSGSIDSGLAVKVRPGLDVDLSQEQLTRLGQAADQAESEGADQAVVMLDGMILKLDVPTRTITGMKSAVSRGVMTGIDSVIMLGSDVPGGTQGMTLPPPAKGIAGLSASVLGVIEDR